MALITCPECEKEISDKSKQCIHCGYPLDYNSRSFELYNMVLKKINKNKNFFFAKGLLESGLEISKGQSYNLLNSVGNCIIKGIEYSNVEYLKIQFLSCGYEMDFVPSDSDYINPINSKISEWSSEWKRKQKNAIKCPTCGSTNVERISTTAKVAGVVTFGLLSKTARSQFKCKHCGYKW